MHGSFSGVSGGAGGDTSDFRPKIRRARRSRVVFVRKSAEIAISPDFRSKIPRVAPDARRARSKIRRARGSGGGGAETRRRPARHGSYPDSLILHASEADSEKSLSSQFGEFLSYALTRGKTRR
jgi:hypothetical protein